MAVPGPGRSGAARRRHRVHPAYGPRPPLPRARARRQRSGRGGGPPGATRSPCASPATPTGWSERAATATCSPACSPRRHGCWEPCSPAADPCDRDSGSVTVGGVKLSTQLMYAGNPREAADQVAGARGGRPRHGLGGRGLRLRLPHADGLPRRQDREGRDRQRDPQRLLPHPERPAADRRRARQRQPGPRDHRPRRQRARR